MEPQQQHKRRQTDGRTDIDSEMLPKRKTKLTNVLRRWQHHLFKSFPASSPSPACDVLPDLDGHRCDSPQVILLLFVA